MKRNTLATLILSASLSTSMFAALPTSVTYAVASESNNAAHALPIKSESPSNQATDVKPVAPVTITLDPSSPNFKRFRQQFINGNFTILINNQPVQATYDTSNYTITVPHSAFSRHASYTVTLLVKAMANGNTASGNASESFTFETGSALGEATHVTAIVANPSVSVDDGGTLNVTATDDYGDPATNATVTVTGADGFISPADVPITNGTASVPLNDHTAESLTLSYTVKDNPYNDQSDDTNSGTVSETFTPGAPKSLTLVPAQTIVQAGITDQVTGNIFDQYDNLATNDSNNFVGVAVNGNTPTSVPINNGTFTYTFGPTDDQKAGQYTITASTDNVQGTANIQVTPGPVDAKTSTVTVNKQSITAGDSVTVSVTPEDQYGNLLGGGQNVSVGDGASTPTQLQWNSSNRDYEGEFRETKSGTIVFSATINGMTLISAPTVVVEPGVPDSAMSTFTFPSNVTAGNDFTVSGTTRDQFGNLVPDQPLTLTFDGKSVTGNTDANGNVSLTVDPTLATTGSTATISTGATTLETHRSVVTAAVPTHLVLNLPNSLLINPTTVVNPFFQSGSYSFSGNLGSGTYSINPSPNPVSVSGSVSDQYGNTVADVPIDYTGSLSGNLTSGADGTYSGQLTFNRNGALSASVNGQRMSILSGNSQTITTVSSSAVTLHYQTGWLGMQVQSGVSQTFSATATETNAMTFNWALNGFVGWFETHERLQMYVTQPDGSKKWYTLSDGSGGWGGFSANGTFTVNLAQGQSYGFVIYGQTYENNDFFAGTLTLSPSN